MAAGRLLPIKRLVFKSESFKIRRRVAGLWQKTDSISIVNCTFLNNNSREALYHSNTCDNTLIENCTFTNTGGIHGTNESDWGTFGVPYEKRLSIRNCTMTAGANDFAPCHDQENAKGDVYRYGLGQITYVRIYAFSSEKKI